MELTYGLRFIVPFHSYHSDSDCQLSYSCCWLGTTSGLSHVSTAPALSLWLLYSNRVPDSVFLEITGKRTFLGVVWFELAWAGLIGMMTLSELASTIALPLMFIMPLSPVGASLITSLSSRELCLSPPTGEARIMFCGTPGTQLVFPVTDRVVSRPILVSPCSSAQVLGVFTWMPATFCAFFITPRKLSLILFLGYSACVYDFALDFSLCTVQG